MDSGATPVPRTTQVSPQRPLAKRPQTIEDAENTEVWAGAAQENGFRRASLAEFFGEFTHVGKMVGGSRESYKTPRTPSTRRSGRLRRGRMGLGELLAEFSVNRRNRLRVVGDEKIR